MAHGTPRINICFDCNQYTLVSRFSENPKCPICGKESKVTSKKEIEENYKLAGSYTWNFNFEQWEKIIPF